MSLSIFVSKQSNKIIQISNNNMREYQLNPRRYFHSYEEDFEMKHSDICRYVKYLYVDAIEVDNSFITLEEAQETWLTPFYQKQEVY